MDRVVIGLATLVLALPGSCAQKVRRDEHNQQELQKYSQDLKPGSTRKIVKDYLRAHGATFGERRCDPGFHAFAVLVKVGKEDVPWYCSEWPVYVAFEFQIEEPYNVPLPVDSGIRKKIEQHELELDPGDSDILQKVQLVSNGEGCL